MAGEPLRFLGAARTRYIANSIAPWVLTYTDRTGASWTWWVVGVIAVVLGCVQRSGAAAGDPALTLTIGSRLWTISVPPSACSIAPQSVSEGASRRGPGATTSGGWRRRGSFSARSKPAHRGVGWAGDGHVGRGCPAVRQVDPSPCRDQRHRLVAAPQFDRQISALWIDRWVQKLERHAATW